MNYSVGVDVGGTNTDLGLVDEQGRVVSRRNLSTTAYADFPTYVRAMVAKADEMVAERKAAGEADAELAGFGIGAPNANYATGCVENAPNLPFKGILDFVGEIGKTHPLPVRVDNDANAAAYGECIYGGAKGMQHFIMFTLGTGVGSGIVVDGKILHGSNGLAGELGHVVLIPGGRLCGCGHHGCLEAYASARGIVRTYLDMRRDSPENERLLRGIADADLTSRHLGEAAQQGDPLALRAWRQVGEWLGQAMANAVAFSAPEALFLMGGPTKVGEPLLGPLRESFERNLLFCYAGSCDVRLSALPDNDTAILGAAALLRQEAV